jgi:hypothetical protein
MRLELPDRVTGEIEFLPTGTRIGATTKQDSFALTDEARQWTGVVDTPEHQSRKLRGTWLVAGIEVGVVMWFDRGVLASVDLFARSSGQSWDTWSEQEALVQRDKLESLLNATYGMQRAFPWGDLCAVYDPRSGSTCIAVRYRHAEV